MVALLFVFFVFIIPASVLSAAVRGDVNGDTQVDLTDAILAMQLSAGIVPLQEIYTSGDVNQDGRIGLAETVFILQIVSQIRHLPHDEGTFTNSLGMTFTRIPAGTFMMGSLPDEPGRWDDETQHQVTLTQAYYMQTTEVTQGQWQAVMGSNPSYSSHCGDDCPVESVSWNDVHAFIAKLKKLGEGAYRLPTEAEWEYAARAGSKTAFANGDITDTGTGYDPNLHVMGWYAYNSGNRTHPVAQKQPNAWGLFDMHGNVWEWVQDWYDSYPSGAVTDPTGPSTGWLRVLRSGYWGSSARNCRSAVRGSGEPVFRSGNSGFRLVLAQVP